MSIEHKLLLKENSVRCEQFMDYCVNKYINFSLVDSECIYLDDLDMNIYFLNSKDKKDIWKSSVYNLNFIYNETISFVFGKDINLWEEQTKFVINCVFDVMAQIKKEALFIYNLDTEVCYFKSDGSRQVSNRVDIIDRFLIR